MTSYTFSWKWIATPGTPTQPKTFTTNTGSWPTAQTVLFHIQANEGDARPVFLNMVKGDHFKVENPANPAIFAEWELATEPVDYTNYFSLPVVRDSLQIGGGSADGLTYNVAFMLGYVPEGVIAEPVFLAVCHGYGGSTADTLYCITKDGKIWIRSVRRDMGWVEVNREKEPLPEPVSDPTRI